MMNIRIFLLLIMVMSYFCPPVSSLEWRREEYATVEDDADDEEQDFNVLLKEARMFYEGGKFLQANKVYKNILQIEDLSTDERAMVRKEYEDVNIAILFSRFETSDSLMYTVQPGDSLYKIAKQYNTTVELIQKSNGLLDSTIYPGDRLKVMSATFSIFIDKSDNILRLSLSEDVLKTYNVATGKENSTPVGSFTIKNKLIDPTWFHAGAIVPPDSPENILGTRWMGFDLRGYGIHGTTIPESIGTQSTKGCIRMFNHDAEELYIMIPVGVQVVIVD